MDTSRAAIESRLSRFRQRCADLGLALTPQRLAIYHLLAADDSHPTVESIFQRLKPDMPSLSLGTVYRTLELLEGHGLVSRVHDGGPQARFDANLDPHHHAICSRCGRVADFHAPELAHLPVPAQLPDGFHVQHHQIQLFGLCAGCRPA